MTHQQLITMSQPILPSYTSSIPEEGVDEGEEEAGEEEVPTLADALAQLGLTDLTETFAKEIIDFDSFVSSVLHSRTATCTQYV